MINNIWMFSLGLAFVFSPLLAVCGWMAVVCKQQGYLLAMIKSMSVIAFFVGLVTIGYKLVEKSIE